MSEETTPACNPPLTAEEIERPPYDAQEQRVCDWIQKQISGMLGCGDDPIGFLLASYEFSRHEMHEAKAALAEKDRRIAELERERDEARSSLAAILKSRDAWQENCLAEKARATSAEALSAAAVERERGMRTALDQIERMEMPPTGWSAYVGRLKSIARAALSSPAPGNGEADHA